MSTEDRAKAIGKNVEGKVQEVFGNITGNKKDQAEGKAKQAEAAARHAAEDLKNAVKNVTDKAKKAIDKL
ncbi:MAG: CsbD family protein [Microcoleus anatoxicus]|uniref:CsbD family protein n=1 Tax=Microcoleus TaxID=44471 RepID=UPI002975038C|nr:MAG: CsbD family protein [Oscillatoriales cyanobacterium]TAF04018.1 MAG: CsbD family protein [Oscillatoriales cyanobacterium]TAF46487.1 MAG: CsbD family protein [Oscillatoriales cyanobacterium]TAF70424.1 MAG: CsbD family protein [Oscillatoriales cyanobacterium]